MNFEKIRKEFNCLKFKNELEYLTSVDPKNDKIEKLTEIIQSLETKSVDTTVQDEIEKYNYKKEWNKLQPFHKIKKLDEYLTKNVKNEKLRMKISKEFALLINNKKLNSNKQVEYNPIEEAIITIPALKIDESKLEYKISV